MEIVAEMNNTAWSIGEENRIIFAKDESGLYICSPAEYADGEGARWYNDNLQEAIDYYSQYHEDWRVSIY